MSRLASTLIALVFAIAFPVIGFIAGIAPLYGQGANWWTSRSYVRVPARVESAELEQRSLRKSGTTYLAKATFSYWYQGQHYTGQRASFSDLPDSAGEFHRRIHEQLDDARQRGVLVDLWVDPSHPERSVFDRTIRWQMSLFHLPFAVLFPAIGLGAWVAVFHIWRTGRKRTIANILQAGQSLRVKGMDGSLFILLFTSAWNLFSWTICLPVLDQVREEGASLALLGLVFPLAGLGLIYFTWYLLRRRWLAGRPVLEITGVAPLRGRFHFQPAIGQRSPPLELMHQVTIEVRKMAPAPGGKQKTVWERCVLDQPVARGTEALDFEVETPRERGEEHLECALVLAGASFKFWLPPSQ